MPSKPRAHRPPGQAQAATAAQHQRGRVHAVTDQARLRNTRTYRRFAAMIRAARPTCEDCQRRPSTQVHHARKLALHHEDLLENEHVRALCASCHSVRTARGE